MRTVEEIRQKYEDDGLLPDDYKKLTMADIANMRLDIKFLLKQIDGFAKAKAEGRLVVLPCKVGDTYTGIRREMIPSKKGWKTKKWLEHGTVVSFDIVAELTADKTEYNHFRNIDEIGEAWFVGEQHKEAAEKVLGGAKDGN